MVIQCLPIGSLVVKETHHKKRIYDNASILIVVSAVSTVEDLFTVHIRELDLDRLK
jgi:hypothetical protein